MVRHISATFTAFRVAGRRPMLLSDLYTVVGCPFMVGMRPSPCSHVFWVRASTTLLVRGIPALTLGSIGMCMGGSGPQGPALITQCQLQEFEPAELTLIND